MIIQKPTMMAIIVNENELDYCFFTECIFQPLSVVKKKKKIESSNVKCFIMHTISHNVRAPSIGHTGICTTKILE